MAKTQVLREILKGHKISGFLIEWIGYSLTDEDTMRESYKTLKRIGLTDEKIASRANLLGMDSESIKRNYQALRKLGLENKNIVLKPELLGRNPNTIQNNYQHLVGLLRQNYEDRESGRELIVSQPQLLEIKPETINANIQFLHSRGIDYNKGNLLGTTSQLKRKKMAWMLREIFDYRTSENKGETIDKMYEFIKRNPKYLAKSISYLERAKDEIKNRVKK